MKLYIPTCTLNFNNIFTTESISPASHYSNRGFGNKRYFKVEANDLDNVVMLYSKYPLFKINDGDMENSPMVIEIESDDYFKEQFVKVGEKDGIESYASNTSIYLNPFHCLIYFQSYQDIQSVMSKAEQSLENKYSKLYARNCIVKKEKNWATSFIGDLFTSSKDEFSWKSSYLGDAPKIPSGDISEDAIIDKVKGCLTCYLLGANMSVSSEVSRLRQLARKMKNTLSAIVNSPDNKPTDKQDETLLAYINEFNEILEKVDDNYKFNNTLIQNRLVSPSTNLDSDTLIKVLKDLRLEDAFYRSLNLRPTYNAHELYTCLDSPLPVSDAYNAVIKKLYEVVRRIEIAEQSKGSDNKLKDLIKFTNGKIEVIDSHSNNHNYYNTLLNSQIDGEYKRFMEENGSSELLSIAFIAGAKLKGYMPDKWEGSEYQQYLNGLLSNIQQGDSFDLFSIEQPVLQALSAFCQKGEDVDRMIDYMQQCGFSEFRYALGLYGATRGFASLPKTFTNSLINSSRDYYKSYYTELCQTLFGLDYSLQTFYQGSNGGYSESFLGEIPSKIISNIGKIEPKPQKQEKIIKAVSETAILEDAVQSPKAFMYIFDSFSRITTTIAYKALAAANFAEDQGFYTPELFRSKIYSIVGKEGLKTQKENIDKAIELEGKRQDPEAFLSILDNFLKPTDAAYKKIVKLISVHVSSNLTSIPRSENKVVPQSHIGRSNLKPINPTSSKFVEDVNVCYFILSRSYLPAQMREVLSKKVVTFQKGYAPGGRYYSNPSDNPVDNKSTIDHFKHWCFYDKGGYPPIVEGTTENKQSFERLTQDLLNRYANR